MSRRLGLVEGSDGAGFQPQTWDEAYGFVRDTLERSATAGSAGATRRRCSAFPVAAKDFSHPGGRSGWFASGARPAMSATRRTDGRGRPFPRRYTSADTRLLADVDEAYGQMSALNGDREVSTAYDFPAYLASCFGGRTDDVRERPSRT